MENQKDGVTKIIEKNLKVEQFHIWDEKRGRAKSRFSDKVVPVTQAPMDQMTWNFACRGLLWVSIEFWSSQGHVTSIKAKPVLASKWDWLL